MKNFPVLRARTPKKKDDATVQNKLTAAERAKRYREKRKNDTSFKEKEKLRKRVAWQQKTLGQKEKDTLRNRKNQQRFREKQKSEGIVLRKASKVLTRKERELKREYCRKKQQESRKKKHPQKIRRKKEKDRVRLRELRSKVNIQKLKKTTAKRNTY